MHYLLFGEDYYSIKEKISSIKSKFLKSDQAGLNLSEIKGEELSRELFWQTVLAVPFLSNKRLIIIKNFLLDNKNEQLKKELAKDLKKIPHSSVVFFIEDGTPDKRSALFKALFKPKISQVFNKPAPNTIKMLIKNQLKDAELDFSTEVFNSLCFLIGDNLFRANNEINKLILYKKFQHNRKIDLLDLKLLIHQETNSGIFDLTEAIADKNNKKAIKVFNELINSGENEIYILSMIVYQYRTMLILEDLLSKNLSQKEIASLAKIHPFVVAKNTSIVKKIGWQQLKNKYYQIEKTDYEIKTGQKEAKLALILLINKLCRS